MARLLILAYSVKKLTKNLRSSLGPGTADLEIRHALWSVTAEVCVKNRVFQVFGTDEYR
jgi:hypothetical protein